MTKSKIYLSEETRDKKRGPGKGFSFFPVIIHDYNGKKISARLTHDQISAILNNTEDVNRNG